MAKVKEVSLEKAIRIIEKRRPIGLFYQIDGNTYVGIDNSTGDAWVEEFPTLEECKNWLLDE